MRLDSPARGRAALTQILDRPAWLSGAVFVLALAFFIGFQVLHVRASGYWTDELFTLWAGDPRQSLADALTKRILPDTNPPLYFSLVFLMRHIFWDGREAILWVNAIGLTALLGVLMWIGWRARMAASALFTAAFFLVGAPALCYAPEGRGYALAMAATTALSFLAAGLAAGRAPGRADYIVAGALAVLSTWLHVYGAIYAGALGGALVLVGWFFSRRADLVRFGFAIGLSAVAAFAIWLAFAAPMFTRTVQAGFWLPFTPASVYEVFWTVKEYSIGFTPAAFAFAAFLALSLRRAESRPIAALGVIAALIFFLIPFLVSFHTVILLGRYLLVGAPALLAITIMMLRAHIQRGGERDPPRWNNAVVGLGALALSAPVLSGPGVADWHFRTRWDWRGMDVIAPLAGACGAGQVRVLNSSIRNLSGFEYLLEGRLEPINAAKAPFKDIAALDCPIYGWAEHYLGEGDDPGWAARVDVETALKAFRLTNNTHIPLRITRHPGGLVLTRAARS